MSSDETDRLVRTEVNSDVAAEKAIPSHLAEYSPVHSAVGQTIDDEQAGPMMPYTHLPPILT